jgi:hypothetical protein
MLSITGCKDTQVLSLTNSKEENLAQIRNPHRLAQVEVFHACAIADADPPGPLT